MSAGPAGRVRNIKIRRILLQTYESLCCICPHTLTLIELCLHY